MDLFSGTLKRPKLRPNSTMTEVDRDGTETETETWTEWCAKNWTGPGSPNPRNREKEGGFLYFSPQTPRRLTWLKQADVVRGTTARLRRGAEAMWHGREWPTRGAGSA